MGIVGRLDGGAPTSNTLRPLVNTSSTIAGATMRGRKSVRIIHW